MENLEQLIKNLVKLPKETSWVEFKRNYYEGEMACIKFVLNEHLTNSSFRERLGVPTSSAGSVSRVIAEAVERKLIKPIDANAGNRYMKYMPYWA